MADFNKDMNHLNCERIKFTSLINFNKKIISAKGAYLYSEEGDTYIDFTSQYGAVAFGHNPDFLWDEIMSQSKLNPGIMIQPFQSYGAKNLANKLIEVSPGSMEHVTLGCTGAEAVEVSIKISRAKTGRRKILSTYNSFHGKSMGAALTTGNKYYSELFYSDNEEFIHICFDNLTQLDDALSSREFAAFIVEPIQGEGGMVVPSQGYLKGCQNICEKYGTLFVLDEIQTGIGRTGSLLACSSEHIEPDIILLAKALGGGVLPISACISNKKSWSPEFCQRHSSTFSNNHLSARVALQVLNHLTDNDHVLSHVREVGFYMKKALTSLVKEFPEVYKDNSGIGFMQGITLMPWRDQDSYITWIASESNYIVALVASYLLNQHKIFTAPTLNASNVLRIQPSYIVCKNQVDKLVNGLRDIGGLIQKGHFEKIFRSIIGLDTTGQNYNSNERYSGIKPEPSGSHLGVFAFFIHPTTDMDIVENMPGGSSAYSDSEVDEIIKWNNQFKSVNYLAAAAYHIPVIPSKNGGYVSGWLISCPLSARELMRLPPDKKKYLLDSYIKVAKEKCVDVIGLGAFTAVISRGGSLLENCEINITTGNSYTALSATDSIRKLFLNRRELNELHLGIVGAAGSVGRLCALDIGCEFSRVSLIGNPKNKNNTTKLEFVAGELIAEIFNDDNNFSSLKKNLLSSGISKKLINDIRHNNAEISMRELYHFTKKKYDSDNGVFPIKITNNVTEELTKCDAVITATSNGGSFIVDNSLLRNTIICDVARPSDINISSNNNVFAYEGGLVNLPSKVKFGGANLVGLPTGVNLACLSETIILTMEQVDKNYSIGGHSSLSEAKKILRWAAKHGFSTHLPSFDSDSDSVVV